MKNFNQNTKKVKRRRKLHYFVKDRERSSGLYSYKMFIILTYYDIYFYITFISIAGVTISQIYWDNL